MVRPPVLIVILALAASGAQAQAHAQALSAGSDWREAGGGLFPGVRNDAGSGDASPGAPAFVTAPVQPWAEVIATASAAHGLDEKLMHAVVIVESAYQAHVCSPAGACGLAQLMPATAGELGVQDRFDPTSNVHGGARYLAEQIARFGDLRLALAAYNAGPGRVARLGRVPDIPETRAYVAAVIECYLALTAGRRVRSARECASGASGP
ncbi:MAG: soluble lytic murein transglycosylase-like protein [Brevundimonas sp.]|jgi:soluble lytic murein transglycosylase-like protein|uniref:lytic transglycosylase domain-containing protein n=1 Tax=Brevundimonas sp. TaxID=1871086 RepID=UPI0039E21648